MTTIPSLAIIRKSSCTSCLTIHLGFLILDVHHILQVVVPIKRSQYGIIVRNSHTDPCLIVIIHLLCRSKSSTSKFPPFPKYAFATLRKNRKERYTHQQRKNKKTFHKSSILYSTSIPYHPQVSTLRQTLQIVCHLHRHFQGLSLHRHQRYK